jgi:hypothetical protein
LPCLHLAIDENCYGGVTFGLKGALYLDTLLRMMELLKKMMPQTLEKNLSAASYTRSKKQIKTVYNWKGGKKTPLPLEWVNIGFLVP